MKNTVPARITTDNYSQSEKTNNILEDTNAPQFQGTAVIDPKVQKSTRSGRGNKRTVPVSSSIKLEHDAISTSYAEQEVWQFQPDVCETNAESDDSAGESSQTINNDEDGFAVKAGKLYFLDQDNNLHQEPTAETVKGPNLYFFGNILTSLFKLGMMFRKRF